MISRLHKIINSPYTVLHGYSKIHIRSNDMLLGSITLSEDCLCINCYASATYTDHILLSDPDLITKTRDRVERMVNWFQNLAPITKYYTMTQ